MRTRVLPYISYTQFPVVEQLTTIVDIRNGIVLAKLQLFTRKLEKTLKDIKINLESTPPLNPRLHVRDVNPRRQPSNRELHPNPRYPTTLSSKALYDKVDI